MKNKKYFCYEIFKNISIWSNQNQVRYNPCSIYAGHIAETNEVDIGSVWNSSAHQQLKQMIADDVPIPGCSVCYAEEAAGRKSRRISVKETYEMFHKDTDIDLAKPQGIDYSVGNLCNLRCVICGPENSTSWIPDYQKLHPQQSIEQYKYNKDIQKLLDDETLLKNIRSIHFHGGGEPLLSENHIKLLEKIDSTKGLADVRVFYNTNGTVIPNDHTLTVWEKCKLVELYFSIDDVGQRFEYQRTGANWIDVCANIEHLKDLMPHNHMFNVNCVWSLLNLYYLNELVDWYTDTISTNRYGDPSNLIFQKAIGITEVKQLTYDIKSVLFDRYKNYPQLTNLIESIPDGPTSNANFWKYIHNLDSVRNTKFSEMFPEWSTMI